MSAHYSPILLALLVTISLCALLHRVSTYPQRALEEDLFDGEDLPIGDQDTLPEYTELNLENINHKRNNGYAGLDNRDYISTVLVKRPSYGRRKQVSKIVGADTIDYIMTTLDKKNTSRRRRP